MSLDLSSTFIDLINAINNASYIPVAKSSAVGGIKSAANRTTSISPTTGGTTSGRYYGVELDNDGTAFVNVPWTDKNPTDYYWANVKVSSTSSNTTVPRFQTMRSRNTVYGLARGLTTGTPTATILHTGIKWSSGSYMPVLHFTGYAYGLQSPVEFKVGFYIYSDKIGYCGATNMGAWKPEIRLFRETRDSVDYVAVALIGKCYYLGLSVGIQEEKGSLPSTIDLTSSMWSFEFLTTYTTDDIPDGNTPPHATCCTVPYKQILNSLGKINFKLAGTTQTTYTGADTSIDFNVPNATTSASGLMTSAMVTKLNGIAEGADSVAVSQKLTSGTEIGSVTINGTATKLYAPPGGLGSQEVEDIVDARLEDYVQTQALVEGRINLSSYGFATETYVANAVSDLVDSSPETLNTLNELATALGDDPNFATTVSTEIGKKQNTITGAATTITSSNLTASRALVSDANGKVAVSAVTSTELGYLDGVTSNIQTQLNNKTDTKVTQTKTTSASSMPLLLAPAGQTATTTTTANFTNNIYAVPSTGRLYVTGSSNPLFGLQATNGTAFYLQAQTDKLYLGPTSAKALTFTGSTGAISMPNNLTVTGTISEGGTTLANKYLGKTAKAASATVADSANAVDWDNISGKPTIPTVSVSQKLTSGTEIGSVTVNGAATKLYAPTATGGLGSQEVEDIIDERLEGYVQTQALVEGRIDLSGYEFVTADALSTYAKLASPTFTGAPKAPTAAKGTNTTQIATTAFVNSQGFVTSEVIDDLVDKQELEGGTVNLSAYNFANKDEGVFYVEGTSTAAGTWLGANTRITAYYDGLTILYKINKAGATTTTLNINSLGAKTVYRYGTTKLTTHYPVNSVILLTYMADLNSGCWMVTGDYDSGNTVPTAHCTTAAATGGKTATCTYYTATANSYTMVLMRYANTYNGAITLNINSTGAKPVYINGAASSSTNKTLPAGTYLVYYDGTNYHFRTDGKIPNVYDVRSITSLDLCTSAPHIYDISSTDGIAISFSEAEVEYDGDKYSTISGSMTLPLVAGDNVTFTKSGDVVEINATGGGSTLYRHNIEITATFNGKSHVGGIFVYDTRSTKHTPETLYDMYSGQALNFSGFFGNQSGPYAFVGVIHLNGSGADAVSGLWSQAGDTNVLMMSPMTFTINDENYIVTPV